MKIANDIRFLGSGPRAGYGELFYQKRTWFFNNAWKSKSNSIEAVTMVCAKVMGNHSGITIAGSAVILN